MRGGWYSACSASVCWVCVSVCVRQVQALQAPECAPLGVSGYISKASLASCAASVFSARAFARCGALQTTRAVPQASSMLVFCVQRLPRAGVVCAVTLGSIDTLAVWRACSVPICAVSHLALAVSPCIASFPSCGFMVFIACLGCV